MKPNKFIKSVSNLRGITSTESNEWITDSVDKNTTCKSFFVLLDAIDKKADLTQTKFEFTKAAF